MKSEKKAFEERCGIKEVAIAPVEVLTDAGVATTEALATPIEKPVTTTVAEPVKVSPSTIADDFEINDDKAVMHLKNGRVIKPLFGVLLFHTLPFFHYRRFF